LDGYVDAALRLGSAAVELLSRLCLFVVVFLLLNYRAFAVSSFLENSLLVSSAARRSFDTHLTRLCSRRSRRIHDARHQQQIAILLILAQLRTLISVGKKF
jgi:hypothetical protein